MLDYAVVQPPSGSAKAWCFVLHGLGDSMAGWRPICDELKHGDIGWILVNAPEPYYGGFSWFAIPGKTDPYATEQQMREDIARSRSALSATIAHVCDELQCSTEQCILMGFSQGCLMVTDQALRGSQRFAGVIAISGWLHDTETFPEGLGPVAKQQTILWTHGMYDDVVPMDRSQKTVAQLRKLGLTIDWRTYGKAHSLDPHRELPDIMAFLQDSLERASNH